MVSGIVVQDHRASMVCYALQHANEIEIRELLALELQDIVALTAIHLNTSLDEKNNYIQELLPIELHTLELRNIFRAYEAGWPEYFLDYCRRKDIFIQYIQYYYNKQWRFVFNAKLEGKKVAGMIEIVARMLQSTIVHHENGKASRTFNYGARVINVGYSDGNQFVRLELLNPDVASIKMSNAQQTIFDRKRIIESSSDAVTKKVPRVLNALTTADASASAIIFSNRKHIVQQFNLPLIERLDTLEQHTDLLQSAFRDAKRYILIASYGVNMQTFISADLFALIKKAREDRVSIYIYANDLKYVDKEILEFFSKHMVSFACMNIHAKILCYDDSVIAIGSFDWLSCIGGKYEQNENSSFLCRNKWSHQLIEDVWRYIKFYTNIQFGNIEQLIEFERNSVNDTQLSYQIEPETSVTYLPTLEAHRCFLRHSLLTAKRRIIICSPFISSGSYEDFSPQMLRATANREVNIYFVCLTEQSQETEFDVFIDQINSPLVHLCHSDDIHLKTLIVDDDIIAEGSFNWISATRDEGAQAHNLETTLIVSGGIARGFIDSFEHSALGQYISQWENSDQEEGGASDDHESEDDYQEAGFSSDDSDSENDYQDASVASDNSDDLYTHVVDNRFHYRRHRYG